MAELKEGAKAPAFSLQSDEGKTVKLSDFAGKTLVLYFYPKADTPGCTRESCDFRDEIAVFKKAKAAVVGVSKDKLPALQKFKEKYDLPFPLLSDPDHKMQETYGAWGKKNMYGKMVEGTIRSTVIIGPDGKIVKHFPKVKVEGHAQAVIEALP
jgi:thioredoxin-dependent peroxiredoxin